ncbi:cytochrome P450 [Zhongshania aliphaticivorans]|uniref:cytochrome P450 n=1 Tax=Zhongshania aliphaticivorans TaxID=1470434 RepID=UPI0039C95104
MKPDLPMLDVAFISSPFDHWAFCRAHAPLFFSEGNGFWVASRHEDVEALLRNTSVFSSASGPGGYITNENNRSPQDTAGFLPLLQNDPPEHTRLRSLMSRSFTSRRIAALKKPMHAMAENLLEGLLAKLERDGQADLYADYASPLPVNVIATLLGIPESFYERLVFWNQALGMNSNPDTQSNLTNEMDEALAAVISEKRETPVDDLIPALVAIADEEGQRLHSDELLGFCKLLWIAGNETTTNLICNAALFLQSHPEILQQLREDKSLIEAFVEESLRLDGPVNGLFRRVAHDYHYKGCELKAGDNVWLLFGSANRDESIFPNAAEFKLARKEAQHLALGKGIHFCMGAPLARMEARVAFEHLVDVMHRFKIDDEGGKRIPIAILRGWLSLPVVPVTE